MASATKLLQKFMYGRMTKPVVLEAKVTVGATGAPTLVTADGFSKGITSIVRNGVGDYTLTLDQTFEQFRAMDVDFVKSDGVTAVADYIVKAFDVASAKTVNFITLGQTVGTASASTTVDISGVTGATTVDISGVTCTPTIGSLTVSTTLNRVPRVIHGGIVGLPTTASTQVSAGGSNASDWNVNVTSCLAYVNSVYGMVEASADFDVDHASPTCANGEDVYAAIVVKESGGALSYDKVLGAAAAHGMAALVTDAALDSAFGSGQWVRICDALFYRDGDASCACSQYFGVFNYPVNTASSGPGGSVDATIGGSATAATTIGGTATAATTVTPALSGTEGTPTDPADGATMYITLLLNDSTT